MVRETFSVFSLVFTHPAGRALRPSPSALLANPAQKTREEKNSLLWFGEALSNSRLPKSWPLTTGVSRANGAQLGGDISAPQIFVRLNYE